MKNSVFVAGVKIVRTDRGTFENHVPSTMTGADFKTWQTENAESIREAKNSLIDQDAEGDTSTPE